MASNDSPTTVPKVAAGGITSFSIASAFASAPSSRLAAPAKHVGVFIMRLARELRDNVYAQIWIDTFPGLKFNTEACINDVTSAVRNIENPITDSGLDTNESSVITDSKVKSFQMSFLNRYVFGMMFVLEAVEWFLENCEHINIGNLSQMRTFLDTDIFNVGAKPCAYAMRGLWVQISKSDVGLLGEYLLLLLDKNLNLHPKFSLILSIAAEDWINDVDHILPQVFEHLTSMHRAILEKGWRVTIMYADIYDLSSFIGNPAQDFSDGKVEEEIMSQQDYFEEESLQTEEVIYRSNPNKGVSIWTLAKNASEECTDL